MFSGTSRLADINERRRHCQVVPLSAGALADQPLAHAVQGLQVELIGSLGGDEFHGRASAQRDQSNRLGGGLGADPDGGGGRARHREQAARFRINTGEVVIAGSCSPKSSLHRADLTCQAGRKNQYR